MGLPGSLSAHAMLCEYAEMAGGKLYISGGNLSQVGTRLEPPHPVHFALAVTVKVPWSATNEQHTLVVELVSEGIGAVGSETDGPKRVPINFRPQTAMPEEHRGTVRIGFNVGRPANLAPGSDALVPVVLPFYRLDLTRLGTYYFAVSVGEDELDRVTFQVGAQAIVVGM
jgi:hypothetical protein